MTVLQLFQIVTGLIVAITPWLVARIALAVASRHAMSVGAAFPAPPGMTTLARATLVVLPVVALAGWSLAPPSLLMGSVDVAAFVALAIPAVRVLNQIEAASRPSRIVEAAERAASLRPRRLTDYVPLAWHVVPFVVSGIGLVVLVWRLQSASGRLVVPVTLILAAPVFLWLYEVWMRSEISGGGSVSADLGQADERRQQRVRWILSAETVLVVGMVGIGHALLGVDWTAPDLRAILGTAGGALLGITGCALALSSELIRRRYRADS